MRTLRGLLGRRGMVTGPMPAQVALKTVLREMVSPALRQHGFRGSGTTWRLANAAGDVAVVNVQSSKFSSADEVLCVINLALVPEPWWALQQVQMPNIKFFTPKASNGLWWNRLSPTAAPGEGERWWHVTTVASGKKVAVEMIRQLEADGVPTLKRLLDRGALISTIRQGDLGFFKGENFRDYLDTALAVMLSGEGRSSELDRLLLKIEGPVDGRPGAPTAVTTADWIRQRASNRI